MTPTDPKIRHLFKKIHNRVQVAGIGNLFFEFFEPFHPKAAYIIEISKLSPLCASKFCKCTMYYCNLQLLKTEKGTQYTGNITKKEYKSRCRKPLRKIWSHFPPLYTFHWHSFGECSRRRSKNGCYFQPQLLALFTT